MYNFLKNALPKLSPDIPLEKCYLPLEFDTTFTGTLIIRVLFVLQSILFVGLIYKIILGSFITIIAILLNGLWLAFAGIFIFKKIGGSKGVIRDNAVQAYANKFLFLKSAAAEGCFPVDSFNCIKLELVFGAEHGSSQMLSRHQRIYLSGEQGPREILLFIRSGWDNAFAKKLAGLLSKDLLEKQVPY